MVALENMKSIGSVVVSDLSVGKESVRVLGCTFKPGTGSYVARSASPLTA